ncbi:MAG TPA: cytochrome c [Vicinamibacterales bacterium]|nr:cytochrome c [Vicinamibacterales bacterium]
MRAALLLVIAVACSTAACTSEEDRGRQLYAERGCAVCHGADGRGDGPAAKRLDTPPRDLTDARLYRQGASQPEIAGSIRSGAGAMPPFRDLTQSEAMDIAAWLVSRQKSLTSGGSS